MYRDVYLILPNNLKLQAPDMSKSSQFSFNHFTSSCLRKPNWRLETRSSERWDRLRHLHHEPAKWSLTSRQGNHQNKQQWRTRTPLRGSDGEFIQPNQNELPAEIYCKTSPQIWAALPLPKAKSLSAHLHTLTSTRWLTNAKQSYVHSIFQIRS